MSFLSYADKTFTLKDKLTIYKVSEVRRLLLEHYMAETEKQNKFYLDLSGVDSMDSAMLQVFISFKRTVEQNKGKLEIKKSCPTFDSVMDILGLSHDVLPKAS